MIALFFGAIYVCGLIGMAGVTIGQIIEVGEMAAKIVETL